MNRRDSIHVLREELKKLTIASNNILRTIDSLEQQESPPEHQRPSLPQSSHSTKDRDGTTIHVGDRIYFLTRGKYKSIEGIVNRFSKNQERVFAIDSDGNEIPRAPRNVRVNKNQKSMSERS